MFDLIMGMTATIIVSCEFLTCVIVAAMSYSIGQRSGKRTHAFIYRQLNLLRDQRVQRYLDSLNVSQPTISPSNTPFSGRLVA